MILVPTMMLVLLILKNAALRWKAGSVPHNDVVDMTVACLNWSAFDSKSKRLAARLVNCQYPRLVQINLMTQLCIIPDYICPDIPWRNYDIG